MHNFIKELNRLMCRTTLMTANLEHAINLCKMVWNEDIKASCAARAGRLLMRLAGRGDAATWPTSRLIHYDLINWDETQLYFVLIFTLCNLHIVYICIIIECNDAFLIINASLPHFQIGSYVTNLNRVQIIHKVNVYFIYLGIWYNVLT